MAVQRELRDSRILHGGFDVLQFEQTLWHSWVGLSQRLQRPFPPVQGRIAASSSSHHSLLSTHTIRPSQSNTEDAELSQPRSTYIPSTPAMSHLASTSTTLPTDHTGEDEAQKGQFTRAQRKRARKTYTKTYLTSTKCEDGDGRIFHCPSIPPANVQRPLGHVQCAAWHSRHGVIDHLFVLYVIYVLNFTYVYHVASKLMAASSSYAINMSAATFRRLTTTTLTIGNFGTVSRKRIGIIVTTQRSC